jgi:hypothetical protein
MLLRAVVGWLLTMSLSSCAGPAFFGPSDGTLTGHVTVRACGGAYRPEQSGCPERPLTGGTLTFRPTTPNGQGSEKTTTTDRNGVYSITLPPGTYEVMVMPAAANPGFTDSPAAATGLTAPRRVTVVTGRTITVNLTYTLQLL